MCLFLIFLNRKHQNLFVLIYGHRLQFENKIKSNQKAIFIDRVGAGRLNLNRKKAS